MAQSPDAKQLALAGSLGVWVYNLGDSSLAVYLDGHDDRVGTVAWSPDGSHLASGSDDTTIALWDPASGEQVDTLLGHSRRVRTVTWSPDGQFLGSGGSDGEIRIWDPESGEEIDLINGQTLHVWDLAWSPVAPQIAWAGADGRVRIQTWDNGPRGEVRSLRGHSGHVWQVYWSPDGSQLASVGEDNTVRVWDAASGTNLNTLDVESDWVNALGWTPTEPVLTQDTSGGLINIHRNGEEAPLLSISEFLEWVTHMDWFPDGRQVAASSLDSTVRFWDLASGEELDLLASQAGPLTGFAISNDGTRLAVGSESGNWEVWSLGETWVLDFSREPVLAGITDMAWSAGDAQLAMAGRDGNIAIWNSASDEIKILDGHRGEVSGVAWSPNGSQLASSSADSSVRVWNPATGETTNTLTGFGDAVTSLAWSPNGSFVATSSADGFIRLTDPNRGTSELAFEDGDQVLAVAWSPDSKLIVSASTDGNDGIVRVWDAESGAMLQELRGHRSAATSLGWDPDGIRLASGSREGAVRIWGLPEGIE
jgi:WD40 repeat protein